MPSSSSASSSSTPPQPPFIVDTGKPVVQLPATIQSEDFHRASDNDLNNTGPCTAPDGPVDFYTKQPNTPGTCDLGNTQIGEWVEYKVRADQAGIYDVAISLATGNQGERRVGLSVNGQDVGNVLVPLNGSATFSEQTVQSVAFNQGENTVRILMVTGGVRFDALRFIKVPGTIEGIDTRDTAAVAVPAKIESEDYSRAFDTDTNNSGGCVSKSGPVDYLAKQPNTGGQCDVINTVAGEWLEYRISVATADEFDLDFSFATGNSGTREVQIYLNGSELGKRSIPRNGGSSYGIIPFNKTRLPAGESTIRVWMTTGGVRFDSINITRTVDEINGPTVTAFSIINTVTDRAVAGYTDIQPGSTVILDLDEIGTNNLVLRAITAGGTQSVVFGLNTRTRYLTDTEAPYAIYQDNRGDYRKWTLFPGVHNITATPYPTDAANSNPGDAAPVRLEIKQAKFEAVDRSVDYISRVNESATSSIVIKNDGNNNGTVTLTNIPNWLTFTRTQASVPAGGEVAFQATSQNCDQQRTRRSTINVETSNGDELPVVVRQACSNNTQFDMAVDRIVINQAVPSVDTYAKESEQIQLVANRSGLFRMFASATSENNHDVEAKLFWRRNGQTGQYDLSRVEGIPQIVDEGTPSETFNFVLPEEFFRPGTEIYVQLDTSSQVAEANEANNRYPLSGYKELNIRDVPRFNITFVPVVIDGRDPNLNNDVINTLMEDTVKLLPIEDYNFNIRAPYTYTGNDQGQRSWSNALGKIAELRRLDSSNRYYHGLTEISVDGGRTNGIAYLSSKSALSRKNAGTIAHEFGHNFSLSHTDCGGPLRPENQYPHADATTNIWGYDILDRLLKSPNTKDLMSYCNNEWTSNFSFNKVLKYRGVEGNSNLKETTEELVDVTWLSGLVTQANDQPRVSLKNTFVAPGKLVSERGYYSVSAFDDSGMMVYYSNFDVKEVDHADEWHFMVAIPSQGVARIEIHLEDNLMLAMPWGSSTTSGTQKQSAPVFLDRLDDERIHLRWSPTPLSSITVRDAETGYVLTNDQSGDAVIITSGDTFEITENKPGAQTTRVITLD